MRFGSFLKEIKKQRRIVEKRRKSKADELSNPISKPVRKKIRVQNQSQTQVTSSPPSSLSPPSPPSSLSPSSDPSSSSHVWIHDVFPSFRGEDIRDNFLSHVQKEFRRKTIKYFNDNGIERGESIAPELIRGIRGSKIAIVLLSRNYASSKWCLEELVEIMKCREELGQTVMAVFYKVDPSDLKKLTGDFGKAFRKTCMGKAKEDISRWKQALEKVATIAGYHSCNWNDEAAMIEDISTDVLNKLINSAQSSHFDNFVGMTTHMENLEPFLRIGCNQVMMIGIWGQSGIGKSTISRFLFNQYYREFQFSVFMENIKRRCPRPYYDEYSAKLKLQEEFLSKIFNQKDIKIHHLGVVQDRLKDKRVLAVLDDVDHLLQIDAIAKEARWFGPGSRIIITTQDQRVLISHEINHIYKVELPPFAEALQIFCMYAFGQKSPHDGFEELAWEVTKLTGKLPLGLKVMGSHFKGRLKHEWKEELPTLRTRLDGEIESTLKFSYDALCDDNKALFLHLACFFNGEEIKIVERCLEKNFVSVKVGIRVLAEKSFISLENWGYTTEIFIKMHDLLVRLGREIVRKESIHEPGQRQFLVEVEDICQVLRNENLRSRNVIGIDLDLEKLKTELKISDGGFERMPNVQFLRVQYGFLMEPYPHSICPVTCLPPNLRFLRWDSFPMTCLPCNFNPEFLVKIILNKTKLEKLWEGNKGIKNLKSMDLSYSKNIKELPDLSTATNLQKLSLRGCSSLVGIPSSIWNLVNLKRLDLSECSSLVGLPSSSENAIIKLKLLRLSGCTSLIELPDSMEDATDLEELDLTGCLNVAKLPSFTGNLVRVYLEDCSSLVELPSSVRNALNLKHFTFNGCSNLVELPLYIGNASYLEELDLSGCSSLRELPSSIGNMTNLKKLYLNGCSSLKSFPEISTNIQVLHLTGTAIEEIPPSIMDMSRLHKLVIKGCTKLVSLPQLPDSLQFLVVDNCESLERLDCSFYKTEFDKLSFVNCFKLNQEARDLIIKTSTSDFAVFPVETVPEYFTYRATGSSLSVKWNGLDTHYPTSLRFKACLLLVLKGDVDAGDWDWPCITYCIKDYLNGVKSGLATYLWRLSSPTSKEHLLVFEFQEIVSSLELVFEFRSYDKNWEILECGLRPLETLAPSC